MNGKKARELRKKSYDATINKPMRKYKKGHATPSYVPLKTSLGNVMGHKKVSHGVPVEMVDHCTRKVYQEMKKSGGHTNVT